MFVFIGVVIGVVCVLMGIGGGVLLVFVLVWFNIDICCVIGCVVFGGLIVVIFGIVSFVIVGWNVFDLLFGSVGYVFVFVILGIVVILVFIVFIGVKVG